MKGFVILAGLLNIMINPSVAEAQQRHCERINGVEMCRDRQPNGSWGPASPSQRVNTNDPNLRPGGATQNPNHRTPGALR